MNMWSLLNLFLDGKKSLVPLTSSVYVESELIGCDRVLVDIGTGYYIEQVCMNFFCIK
jgi:prefoldin subunit 5